MTSTADIPPAPAPAIEPAPKPSPWQRLTGVIAAPIDTFTSIARRPDWVVPFLAIFIISLAAGILIATRVDFTELAHEAIEMNPNAKQVPDSAVRFTAAIMKVSAYASPILTVLSLLIVAAVLQVSFRLFAGEVTFLQSFSVTLYAWVPRLIKAILSVIVIFSRPSISLLELSNPVMSNLGFLVDAKANPVLYAVASSIDLFAIWSVVLLIVGFAIASRLSRARSAAIVIGWWIVVNLFSLIGPAMQMMRR
jgi:Yip1-like protein